MRNIKEFFQLVLRRSLETSDLRLFEISHDKVSTRSLFASIHQFQRLANGDAAVAFSNPIIQNKVLTDALCQYTIIKNMIC